MQVFPALCCFEYSSSGLTPAKVNGPLARAVPSGTYFMAAERRVRGGNGADGGYPRGELTI